MDKNRGSNLEANESAAQNLLPVSEAFSPMALRIKIASYAKELGFDLCGFSPAKIEDKYLAVFEDWLSQGLHADMSYMEKIEQRRNLQNVLPGAQSVVVLAVNYNREQAALAPGHGRIARYAYGRDYHKVIGGMLKKLEKFIEGLGRGCTCNCSASSDRLEPNKLSVKGSVTTFPKSISKAQPSLDCADCTGSCSISSDRLEPNKLGFWACTKLFGEQPSEERRWKRDEACRERESSLRCNPDTSIRCKSYVDTGPILERALAEQAGLGQIGKNGCLITREFGSWVFLSEVITTLDLNLPVRAHTSMAPHESSSCPLPCGKNAERQNGLSEPLSGCESLHVQMLNSDSGLAAGNSFPKNDPPCKAVLDDTSQSPPRKAPHPCGNCTKCITACPTGAIIRPGVVDARLCISYLTIENRDKIPPHLAEKIKETKRIFGCDICQEVCPHNVAKGKPLTNEGLQNAIAGDQLSIKEILEMETAPIPLKQDTVSSLNASGRDGELSAPDQAFLARFAGSPLMRAKRIGLTRNMKTCLTVSATPLGQ